MLFPSNLLLLRILLHPSEQCLLGVFPRPGRSVPRASPSFPAVAKTSSLEGGTGLRSQSVGDDPFVAHLLRAPGTCSVQHRTGIPRPVRTDPKDLCRSPVVQIPRNRTARNRHPAQPIPLVAGNRKLVTSNRNIVPMQFSYISIRRPECDRPDLKQRSLTSSAPSSQHLAGDPSPIQHTSPGPSSRHSLRTHTRQQRPRNQPNPKALENQRLSEEMVKFLSREKERILTTCS